MQGPARPWSLTWPERSPPDYLSSVDRVSWVRFQREALREGLRRRAAEAEVRTLRYANESFRLQTQRDLCGCEAELELSARDRECLTRKVSDLERMNAILRRKERLLNRWREYIVSLFGSDRGEGIRSLLSNALPHLLGEHLTLSWPCKRLKKMTFVFSGQC